MENTENSEKNTEELELNEDLEPKDSVTELKAEPDYKEKYFYLAAEMENLRKRMEREKSQTIKYGNENILSDMIRVLDNFELTMNAIKNDDDKKVKNIYIGLDMVSKQFLDLLKGHGLEKIETENKEFDPNFHEAIAKEVSDKKDMMILKEQQSGYILSGRVLRAAKVTVAGN